MKCGFCAFFCPVYQEERVETKAVCRPGATPKMRVGFFMGCATDFVYPALGLSVLRERYGKWSGVES
jgi:hypothetical protein